MAFYSEKVMDHFANPRNVGEIKDASGVGEVGNPVCGDMMKFYIKVENNIIKDVKFKTFGCGAAIAVSSMVSEMAMGKTIEEALQKASEELNTPVSDLIYIDTGKKSGLFSKKVQVEVYDLSDIVRYAEDYLLNATDALGIESSVKTKLDDDTKRKKEKLLEEDIVPRKVVSWKKHKQTDVNVRKPLRSITGRVLPSTFLKADRKIRKTFYLKEALIFMIVFTLIDFIGFYRVKKIDMFHIFDNSIWNIVLTTTLTMLIIFIGTYMLDYIVTEITLRIRKRKR